MTAEDGRHPLSDERAGGDEDVRRQCARAAVQPARRPVDGSTFYRKIDRNFALVQLQKNRHSTADKVALTINASILLAVAEVAEILGGRRAGAAGERAGRERADTSRASEQMAEPRGDERGYDERECVAGARPNQTGPCEAMFARTIEDGEARRSS